MHNLQGLKMEMKRYGSEVEVYTARIRYDGEVEECTKRACDVEKLQYCTEEGWMCEVSGVLIRCGEEVERVNKTWAQFSVKKECVRRIYVEPRMNFLID